MIPVTNTLLLVIRGTFSVTGNVPCFRKNTSCQRKTILVQTRIISVEFFVLKRKIISCECKFNTYFHGKKKEKLVSKEEHFLLEEICFSCNLFSCHRNGISCDKIISSRQRNHFSCQQQQGQLTNQYLGL